MDGRCVGGRDMVRDWIPENDCLCLHSLPLAAAAGKGGTAVWFRG